MDNIKNIARHVAMVPLKIAYVCWYTSSFGVPFITFLYVKKLDQMQGLPYSSDILYSIELGPFSIPISLIHAISRTLSYFNYYFRQRH